jgi:hypothetical protein
MFTLVQAHQHGTGAKGGLKIRPSANRAAAYAKQGCYDNAEPHKRALVIYEKALGHNSGLPVIGFEFHRVGRCRSERRARVAPAGDRWIQMVVLDRRVLALGDASSTNAPGGH